MTFLYHILVKKLRASTLLETITASVIFMIVFTMAMDTMTRLLSFDGSDADYIVMENDIKKCRKQLALTELQMGKKSCEYDWGEINVEIVNYKGNVYQVDMTTNSYKKRRQITYRFLQANP